MLPTEQIYMGEGYQQQQQPIAITWCFIGFTQSSDDYTVVQYFTHKNKINT